MKHIQEMRVAGRLVILFFLLCVAGAGVPVVGSHQGRLASNASH